MKWHSKLECHLIILTFTTLIIFPSFTIVGNNSINYHQGLKNTSIINNIKITPWKTTLFIPNQLLDEQRRFLGTITYQIVNLL